MFCPNCGNDCGHAKFCIKCGTKVEREVKESYGWSVGLPCPHCGGTQLEGKNCAFCNAQLISDEPEKTGKEDVSTKIPCGVYKGVLSTLTLYEKECVVKSSGFFRKYEARIPYNQITAVVFQRCLPVSFANGNLLFRWTGNKEVPIPPDDRITADKTTVSTSTYIDTIFYHVYYALRAIAPDTAEFRMVIPEVNIPELDEYVQKADLTEYFDKYAPYRLKATEAFCKRTGAPEKVGKVLIDRLFDKRQKAIYDVDPKAAIRDLNLIVEDKIRKEENAAQERAERKEQYARDNARMALEEMQRREWDRKNNRY